MHIMTKATDGLKKSSSGTTIIEVLLATVVLAVVVSGSFTLSNRATQIGQNAVERSQVSNNIQSQIEAIRGMRDNETDSWERILSSKATSAKPSYSACRPSTGSRPFYVNQSGDLNKANAIVSFSLGAKFASGNVKDSRDDIFKIWAEAYSPAGKDYVDIHVRACWEPLGGAVDNSSSAVYRLHKGGF